MDDDLYEQEVGHDGALDRKPPRRFSRTLKLGALCAVLLVVGFGAGLTFGQANASSLSNIVSNTPLIGDGLSSTPDPSLNFTDFWKVYNALNTKFVQTHASTTPSTAQTKMYGAIEGLVASFGDPYTVFFPPSEAAAFNEDISGNSNFEGVGMELGENSDGVLTVISPLKGTPASRAGILAGDLIIAINGTSTEGMSTDAAVNAIRGPKGSVVTFSILRGSKNLTIKVTRDTIQIPTIDTDYNAKTGIYTITLYEFTANSADLFTNALADFKSKGSDKLIIDLRGNPGGYLTAAVSMASHFLPAGSVVVTEDYKGKQDNIVHKSTGSDGVPANTKVVMLIDQGSASASEIFSGAMQDDKRATLIGTRSFGKGSVQELINIGDAALKVTVARWLTPNGRSISDGGLTPDIKVDRTEDQITSGQDPQMDRAVQFLETGK